MTPVDPADVFEDDDYYTGPPLDDGLVDNAEGFLGLRLPRSYLRVLSNRNGGVLRRRCLPTAFATSWARDHVEVRALLGIGGEWEVDGAGPQDSRRQIEEWGYPRIGVVICDLPSGGHDAIMLDYSECGPDGEPAVVYVDGDRRPRQIAESFEAFLLALRPCAAE